VDKKKKSVHSKGGNMTDLELIFTMLGERVNTEISENKKPEGMTENTQVAKPETKNELEHKDE